MSSIAWWPTVVVLVLATLSDIRSRRIPNLLVIPYLAAGIVVGGLTRGLDGIGSSLAGIGLATALIGGVCYLKGMGLGDLKLFAAVGGWIGPGQLILALIATAIVGGFLSVGYAVWRGSLGKSLDGAGDVVVGLVHNGFRPHRSLCLDHSDVRTMPYAPAIALGTLFSFFVR